MIIIKARDKIQRIWKAMRSWQKSAIDWIKHYRWVICGVVLPFLFGAAAYALQSPESSISLSEAMLPVLATILSLFFTVTFVVAQMMRWSHNIFELMGSKFRLIFIAYSIGIVFSALVLKYGSEILKRLENIGIGYSVSISMAIGVTAFYIFILIPYFLDLKEILKLDEITKLIQDAMETIDKGYEWHAVDIIRELSDLGESFASD